MQLREVKAACHKQVFLCLADPGIHRPEAKRARPPQDFAVPLHALCPPPTPLFLFSMKLKHCALLHTAMHTGTHGAMHGARCVIDRAVSVRVHLPHPPPIFGSFLSPLRSVIRTAEKFHS